MSEFGFHLFDTAVGVCAVVWRGDVIVGAQLPEVDESTGSRRLARRFAQAVEIEPSPAIAAAIAEGVRDLAHLAVDLSGVDRFDRRVLEIARRIPPGRSATYGQIAAELGQPRAAQAVGAALGAQPDADYRALPPGVGGGRQGRRLLGARRGFDQASASGHRERANQ